MQASYNANAEIARQRAENERLQADLETLRSEAKRRKEELPRTCIWSNPLIPE